MRLGVNKMTDAQVKEFLQSLVRAYDLFTPNQKAILSALNENGECTRKDLMEKTGKARSVVYDNCVALMEMGFVERIQPTSSLCGRPALKWKLTDKMKDTQKTKEEEKNEEIGM